MVFYCCVPGCNNTNKQSKFHRFPHFAEDIGIFNQWIQNIGRRDLLHMDQSKVYRSYRVCDIHFASEVKIDPAKYFSRTGLQKGVCPTLQMPISSNKEATSATIDVPDMMEQLQEPSLCTEQNASMGRCISHEEHLGEAPTSQKEQPSTSEVVPEPELHIQDVHCSTESKATTIPPRGEIAVARQNTSINNNHLLKAEGSIQSLEISKIQNEPEVLKTPNSNNFCRLCLEKGKPKDLQNLEGEYIPIAPVVDFLEAVLGYTFPESTCENCFKEITQISLFIEKCLDAQKVLKQIREDHDYIAADKNENETKEEKIPGSHATTVEPVNNTPLINSSNDDEMNIIKSTTPKVCDKCGETTTSLTKHYKISKECQPKNVLCAECGKTFAHISGLEYHMGSHIKGDSLPFMCHICSKMFRYNNNLQKHLQVHDAGHQFVCEKCGKCFRRTASLQKHLKRHLAMVKLIGFSRTVMRVPKRGNGNEKMTCSVCNKEFGCEEALRMHMAVHDTTYQCKTSKEELHSKILLDDQSTLLGDEKPYSCDLCEKKFKLRATLRMHVRTHTGERPYKCPLCSKAFTQHSRLKYHMQGHTMEKTFACEVCNKSFYRRTKFIEHRRIHTGEKPYQCHVCGESFRNSNMRKEHIIRSHGLEQVPFIKIANISES